VVAESLRQGVIETVGSLRQDVEVIEVTASFVEGCGQRGLVSRS
jgi:hypothetical protein